VETFVADCVASLREQTAQLCEDMLHSINHSETGVHQKTLNRLVKFIDQFKQMNFVNDTEMEQQLENVRKELLSKTAEEYRDSSRARNRLVNGLSALANQARQLAKQDASDLVQRFGQVGVRKFNLAA
jgi:Fe-S cluster assembly scaffold protein SufB